MWFPALAAIALISVLSVAGCGVLLDRRTDRRAAVARAAYPPTGQLLDVGGTTVHAHVEGAGPDLVLIHGASGNTRDFTFDLVGRLAPHYRVIAFDRPGLGWTDDPGDAAIDPAVQADLLRAAAGQLGVRNPVVLGHSYGAAVALAWALNDPGGIRALVLVSGVAMPWPGGLGLWYRISASALGDAILLRLLAAFAGKRRADEALAVIFRPQQAPKGYVDHIGVELTLRQASLRANARQVNGLKPHLVEMSRHYAGLHLPVELIHGTADTIVPIAVHSDKLATLLPNAHLTRLSGVGHMPHHTNPEAVIDAIRRASAHSAP